MQIKSKLKSLNSKLGLRVLGVLSIVAGVLLFTVSYYKIIFLEIKYRVSPPNQDVIVALEESEVKIDEDNKRDVVEFVDNEFGIIIPKIDANARIISNVDPFNEAEYTLALEDGIAHADGTSLPGQDGNVFMFAHSAVNFYEASKFNVHFYLLEKLEKGDLIYVAYEDKIYTYSVIENVRIDPSDLSYLTDYREYNTLTLMTCWPPGTNYKRTIVVAKELISTSE
jgi:LPXTG-site transpeptidase (sortase) family protein